MPVPKLMPHPKLEVEGGTRGVAKPLASGSYSALYRAREEGQSVESPVRSCVLSRRSNGTHIRCRSEIYISR